MKVINVFQNQILALEITVSWVLDWKQAQFKRQGRTLFPSMKCPLATSEEAATKAPVFPLESPLEPSLSVKCFRLLMWPESLTKARVGAWLPDSNPRREGKPSLSSFVMSLSNILNHLTERGIVMTRHSISSSWVTSAVKQQDSSRLQLRRLPCKLTCGTLLCYSSCDS